MRFRFTSDSDELAEQLVAAGRKVAQPAELLSEIGEYMENVSIPATFEAEGRPTRWERTVWSAERQMVRTGGAGLLGSIQHEVTGRRLRIGTNKKYAPQRHYGGDIVARGKSLVVPVPGLPATKRRPRSWGKRLKWAPLGKGDTVGALGIVRKGRGKKGKSTFEVKFWLRKRVTQKARPFLVWQPEDLEFARTAILKALGVTR